MCVNYSSFLLNVLHKTCTGLQAIISTARPHTPAAYETFTDACALSLKYLAQVDNANIYNKHYSFSACDVMLKGEVIDGWLILVKMILKV